MSSRDTKLILNKSFHEKEKVRQDTVGYMLTCSQFTVSSQENASEIPLFFIFSGFTNSSCFLRLSYRSCLPPHVCFCLHQDVQSSPSDSLSFPLFSLSPISLLLTPTASLFSSIIPSPLLSSPPSASQLSAEPHNHSGFIFYL